MNEPCELCPFAVEENSRNLKHPVKTHGARRTRENTKPNPFKLARSSGEPGWENVTSVMLLPMLANSFARLKASTSAPGLLPNAPRQRGLSRPTRNPVPGASATFLWRPARSTLSVALKRFPLKLLGELCPAQLTSHRPPGQGSAERVASAPPRGRRGTCCDQRMNVASPPPPVGDVKAHDGGAYSELPDRQADCG